MMPGSGAGENDTRPRTMWPSMMVLSVNTFVFGFLSIVVESFSIGIVPKIFGFVEWITSMSRVLIPGRDPRGETSSRGKAASSLLSPYPRAQWSYSRSPPSTKELRVAIGKSLQGPVLEL